MKTKRAEVKGLGSSGQGTSHFWVQRITGLVNMVLGLFLIVTIANLVGKDYSAIKYYFSKPWNMALMVAFILSAAWHMKLGLQVVIEDYVHCESCKIMWLITNVFFASLGALVGVFAVLRLGLGA